MAVAHPLAGPFSALAHRDFRIYWLGQAVSLVGAWMQTAAQWWVVTTLTDSKTAMSLVSVVWSLPMVAFALFGGSVSDRFDRRRILILTQILMSGLALLYAGLIFTDHLTLTVVYALSAALGLVMAFDLPAQHALVPQLVPPRHIPHAVSLNQALFHGSRFLGPPLAGLVMAISLPLVFAVNAVSYVAVIVSLAVIRPAPQKLSSVGVGLESLKEGLAYIRRHADVRALLAFTAFTSTLVMPFLIVFLAITVKTLYGGDEVAYGMVMGASGIGAGLGAIAITRVAAGSRGKTIIVVAVVAAACLAVLALLETPAVAALGVGALAFCVSLGTGLCTTIIQIKVPDAVRGRVMSVNTLVFTALMPSASLVLGILADQIGMRWTTLGMAAAYVLLALPWLLRAGVWRLRAVEGVED